MRAVAVAACLSAAAIGAGPTTATPHRVTVHIANFSFVPADTTIITGDTVVWINDDDFEHVVAADTAAWKSPTLTHGRTFTWVARRAGLVRYHCDAHPVMHGALTIE